MALFDIPTTRGGKDKDEAIAKKLKSKSKAVTTIRGGNSLMSKIDAITAMVEKNLGQYKDEYIAIRSDEVLHDYITECIGNGYIAIDTETTGLNPLLDTLVGICPYTYGQKGAYIPINHISCITQEKVPNQLPIEFIISEFKRLFAKKPDIDMFNAVFDIRVLRKAGLSEAYCTWDCSVATKILNENEPTNRLKPLHNKYCLNGKGDAFTFDDLFKGVTFNYIPIDVGFLYAAHDPVITSEYSDFQRIYLRADSDREDMRKLYWVFKNIEMPIVDVVADLEDTGVLFDFDYNAKLKDKYHNLLDEKRDDFNLVCEPYKSDLDKLRSQGVKLDDPINIQSPEQLGVLLYDVMKCDLFYDKIKKKYVRSTAEEQLLALNNDVSKAILNYREFSTIVSTFIDKLPECVNPNDGRIHCKFNQYGAATGRFSSKDPNMQNIPSHNKDIRKMFVASPGYVLLSSDYSQQEPSCLATFCKDMGYDALFNARFKGNDLYSEVASACFGYPYEQCCEFAPDGSKNPPEYKERRSQAKPILLGILYGRGDESVAEQLNCSEEEAKQLKTNLYSRFPEIAKFEKASLDMAKELGYVTTVCGRKRRLPELQLPPYEFKWTNGVSPEEDLLDFSSQQDTVDRDTQEFYLRKLSNVYGKKKFKIIEEANQKGITVVDNGGKIADATRQCVNARIQGSAADLTKLAMIKLNNNEELKQMGFRMLIPVHDEIIAECKEENAKRCAELLAKVMSEAAEDILHMPFSCDVEISRAWYGESITGEQLKEKEVNTSHGLDVEKLREGK